MAKAACISSTTRRSVPAEAAVPAVTDALTTSRRGFLVRAFALTASGAAVTVPIITQEDARARIAHHAKQLEAAMRDYYVGMDVRFSSNNFTLEQAQEFEMPAHYQFTAQNPVPAEYRRVFKSYDDYQAAALSGRIDPSRTEIRNVNEGY